MAEASAGVVEKSQGLPIENIRGIDAVEMRKLMDLIKGVGRVYSASIFIPVNQDQLFHQVQIYFIRGLTRHEKMASI